MLEDQLFNEKKSEKAEEEKQAKEDKPLKIPRKKAVSGSAKASKLETIWSQVNTFLQSSTASSSQKKAVY